MLLFHCSALQAEPVAFSCTAVIKREQPGSFGLYFHFGHSLQLNAGSVTAKAKKYPQRETDPCWSLSSPESKPRKAAVRPLVLCSDQTYLKLFVWLHTKTATRHDIYSRCLKSHEDCITLFMCWIYWTHTEFLQSESNVNFADVRTFMNNNGGQDNNHLWWPFVDIHKLSH